MVKQTIGWILIALGVVAILWGIWDSFQIFTAKKEAPLVFKTTAVPVANKTVANAKNLTAEQIQAQLQEQMQQAVKDSLSGMLPADSITKTLNLASWSIFMGILIFAGGKIGELGIKLLANNPNKKDI